MNIRDTAVLFAACFVAVVAMVVEASPQESLADPVQAVVGPTKQVTLTLGRGQLFRIALPFAKVSVTDDKIVEVMPQSDREFVINPRALGSTDVFIIDGRNALIERLDVNVTAMFPAEAKIKVYRRISEPVRYQCNDRECNVATNPEIVVPPTEQSAKPDDAKMTEPKSR